MTTPRPYFRLAWLLVTGHLSLVTGLAASLTLGWNGSTNPTVSGTAIYWGVATGTNVNFTNRIAVPVPATSITLGNLNQNTSYGFTATTIGAWQLESAANAVVFYTFSNQPPTLSNPPNVVVTTWGAYSVALAGISSGGESQPISITAASNNTNVVNNLSVVYTSPQTNGVLSFNAVHDGFATNTVTVSDGVTTTSKSFVVTVLPPSPSGLSILSVTP